MTKGVYQPNLEAEQSIKTFVRDLISALPHKMGTPELIPGCEVIDLDPFATATLPRQITVRINQYHTFVTYRGAPTLTIGDLVLVAHLREGNQYEVIGISGSGGSISPADLLIGVWVFDVSLALLVQFATINAALAYGPLAADDYVLIGPGEYDEAITLVNGVFITEMVPGSVIINLTTANVAVTTVGGGYLQVKEIRVTRANNDIRAVSSLHNAGDCTIIAELIRGENAGTGRTWGVAQDGTGNLLVVTNNIQASGGDVETIAVNCDEGTQIVYGNLLAENGTASYSTAAECDGATADQTIYGDCLVIDDDFLYGVVCAGGGIQTIRGHCTAFTAAGGGEAFGAWCVQAGSTQIVYGDVSGTSPTVSIGAHCTNGTQRILYGRASGATADLRQVGGILEAFAVQHDTVVGTITWLDGTALESFRDYVQGNLIIGGGADWEALAIGNVEDVLVVNAAGTEPEWADRQTLGRWEPLADGDTVNPELLFDALGDPIMVWMP